MNQKAIREPTIAAVVGARQAGEWAGLGPRGGTAELRRLLASARLMLALIAALSMFDVIMNDSARLVVVLGFASYAAWLFWLELSGSSLPDSYVFDWADAAWCLLLVAANGVAQSISTIYAFFPVLFTALRWGPRHGMAMAIILALGVLALLSPWSSQRLEGHALTLPVALLVLGPLIAALARTGRSLARRLALAGKLAQEADPRLGMESVARTVLKRLCDEFGADAGLLVFSRPGDVTQVFRCQDGGRAKVVPLVSADYIAQQLAALPSGLVAAYNAAGLPRLSRLERYDAYDLEEARVVDVGSQEVSDIASLIECSSVVTTPVAPHGRFRGRVVIGVRDHPLDARDAGFLCHIMEQFSPILENAALLERLAADAAEHERTRIGRDLHDSAIQPYIGLKFAIEALARRVAPDDPLALDVDRLAQMANEELAALRDLVTGLRAGRRRGDAALVPSVRRQAARFAELFGIGVEVDVQGELAVNRNLAGEIFHMVSEGLSNIRRHTRASRAWIVLRMEADFLVLQISNDYGNESAPAPFRPRSLSERAQALGGTLEVTVNEDGRTSAVARIPLDQAER